MLVLVVEDNIDKFNDLRAVLCEGGIDPACIHHALNAAHAVEQMEARLFDLVLLDLNIPKRFDEKTERGAGLLVLRAIDRTKAIFKPHHIVGVSQFEDAIAEFGGEFAQSLWTIIRYKANETGWRGQLLRGIAYIKAKSTSSNFRDGLTFGFDLAIICALEDVEWDAVMRLPFDWQDLRLRADESRYKIGSITRGEQRFSVVAATAERMGMAHSAVLASKVVSLFRPRQLAMTGICAGTHGKTNLGDVIVGDPVWDWGSGKIESRHNKSIFIPSPHQIDLEVDIRGDINDLVKDPILLAQVKQTSSGKKPSTELKAYIAPMASGAAVVADAPTFKELLYRHRQLRAIEMEAYGVAVAARLSGKPRPIVYIVKSVCDFADKDKDDDYQEYAASTSANFVHQIALKTL